MSEHQQNPGPKPSPLYQPDRQTLSVAKAPPLPPLVSRDAEIVARELDVLLAETNERLQGAQRRFEEAGRRAAEPALAKADSHASALSGGATERISQIENQAASELSRTAALGDDGETPIDGVAAAAARDKLEQSRRGNISAWSAIRSNPVYAAAQKALRTASRSALAEERTALEQRNEMSGLAMELNARCEQVREVHQQMLLRGERGTVLARDLAPDASFETKIQASRDVVLPNEFKPEPTPGFSFDPKGAPPKFIAGG